MTLGLGRDWGIALNKQGIWSSALPWAYLLGGTNRDAAFWPEANKTVGAAVGSHGCRWVP